MPGLDNVYAEIAARTARVWYEANEQHKADVASRPYRAGVAIGRVLSDMQYNLEERVVDPIRYRSWVAFDRFRDGFRAGRF